MSIDITTLDKAHWSGKEIRKAPDGAYMLLDHPGHYSQTTSLMGEVSPELMALFGVGCTDRIGTDYRGTWRPLPPTASYGVNRATARLSVAQAEEELRQAQVGELYEQRLLREQAELDLARRQADLELAAVRRRAELPAELFAAALGNMFARRRR